MALRILRTSIRLAGREAKLTRHNDAAVAAMTDDLRRHLGQMVRHLEANSQALPAIMDGARKTRGKTIKPSLVVTFPSWRSAALPWMKTVTFQPNSPVTERVHLLPWNGPARLQKQSATP